MPLASSGTSTYYTHTHTTTLRLTHTCNLKFKKSTWQDGPVTAIPSMGMVCPTHYTQQCEQGKLKQWDFIQMCAENTLGWTKKLMTMCLH